MSLNILQLIPADPGFVPDKAAVEIARVNLRMHLPPNAEVHAEVTENVEFVDQGENFEQVRCPNCGSILDSAWWQNAMDRAYQVRFEDLSISLPCCDGKSSLNELDYDWPAGFARFSLQVSNPGISALDEGVLVTLEAILGTRLRTIWAHY